jgi:hypothetical protein
MAAQLNHPGQWAPLLSLVLLMGASIPSSHGRTVPLSEGAETVSPGAYNPLSSTAYEFS